MTLKECESLTDEDRAALEKMGSVFKHPITLTISVGKNISINGFEIYHEVSQGIVDYKNGNWADAGVEFGEAASVAIWGKPAQIQTQVE